MTREDDGARVTARAGERASLLAREDCEQGVDADGAVVSSSAGARKTLVGALFGLALICLGASANSRATALPSLGSAPKLTLPIYIMGDAAKGSEDATKIAKAYAWLSGLLKTQSGMSEQEIGRVINFQQATFPSRWPETHEVAVAATSRIDPDALERIPFVGGAASDNPTDCGRACGSQLSHHTGCLLTHMAVWNRVIDSNDDTFVLWESDGATLNAVHPLDYPKLREHLPDDFDIVWLKPDDHSNGQLIKRFKSAAKGLWDPTMDSRLINGNDVYLYKFDKACNWAGTPSYMMSRKGAMKIMKFIKEAEFADMIDAWLSRQCIARCDDPKVCINLNCYIAGNLKVPKGVLGGYVPDWYDVEDDEDVREVDSRIVSMMDDTSKFNQLGCKHGKSYEGFVPTAWEGGFGITDNSVVCDCWHTPKDGTFDFCDANLKLPVEAQKVQRGEATLGGTNEGGTRETIMGSYERGFRARMALLDWPLGSLQRQD